MLVVLACLFTSLWLGACTSPGTGDRWSSHFDASVWGGSFETQLLPNRLVPEATLLAMLPVAFVFDDEVRDAEQRHEVNATTHNIADSLQIILPAIPSVIGIVDWTHGDEGRNCEVVAESLISTFAASQIIARSVGRERPNHHDNRSFPSGHTSWAFAATTLISRDLQDPGDDSFHPLHALLYIPAIFAGYERISEDRHWLSDVVFGAFLGVIITNLIWDAHYPGGDEKRSTIFRDERGSGMSWRPNVEVIDGRIVLGVAVGF